MVSISPWNWISCSGSNQSRAVFPGRPEIWRVAVVRSCDGCPPRTRTLKSESVIALFTEIHRTVIRRKRLACNLFLDSLSPRLGLHLGTVELWLEITHHRVASECNGGRQQKTDLIPNRSGLARIPPSTRSVREISQWGNPE